MAENDESELLREIRDTQREHLAEYRRVTQKLIANQELAVQRAKMISRVAIPLLFFLLLLVVVLFVLLWRRLV